LGDPTVWIRLPSLALGVATIPLIFILGRETIGRTPGLIAAAILAASPFSTYYGIEARPYATMGFFLVLSTLALVKAVRTSGRGWWLLYALAAAAAAYSHYTSVFVLAVQAGWSLWVRRDRLREPLLANLLIVLVYIPWLPHVRSRELVIGALTPLNAHGVLVDLTRPIGGYPYASPHAIPTIAGLAVVGAFALMGAFAVGWRARGAWLLRVDRHNGAVLIVALAIATPVGALIYSVLGTDIWEARALYASVPFDALVLAWLLVALPRPVSFAGVAAVLAVLAFATARAVSPRWARPPFRPAAQYLDKVAGPADPVVLYPSFLGLTIDIPTHFHSQHAWLRSSNAQWPQDLSGPRVYVVMDDNMDRALRIPTPHPPGFKLVSRRHYAGLLPFAILGYQRTG
jgi:mannosyltransferase